MSENPMNPCLIRVSGVRSLSQLKKQYSDSQKIIEKEALENKIKENETSFGKAILMQPFYGSNNWRSGIDADSIQYDKNAGIIYFTTSSINEVSGVKRVSGMKIYVCEQQFTAFET